MVNWKMLPTLLSFIEYDTIYGDFIYFHYSMTKFLLFIGFILFGLSLIPAKTVSWKSASLEFNGYVNFNFFHFINKDPISEIGSGAHLKLQTKYPFQLVLSPYILLDVDSDGRSTARFADELYLDYLATKFEMRLGWQKFDWGSTQGRRASDFLNQRDYEYHLLYPVKMGELAARGRIIFNLSSGHMLDFFCLPIFKPALLPGSNNRFHIFKSDDPKSDYHENYEENIIYTDSLKEYRPQGGFRYQIPVFNDFKIALFYFNGYERFPGLISESEILYPYYRLIHKGGATLSARAGRFGFNGEAVYNHYQTDSFYHIYGAIHRNDEVKTDPYFEYTGGAEFYFNSPESSAQWVSTLELIMDSDADKSWQEIQTFRPFRSHIFFGIRRFQKEGYGREITLGTYFNYLDPGLLYHLEWGEMLFDNVMLKFSFTGLSVEENSWLKAIDDTMNAQFGIYYLF